MSYYANMKPLLVRVYRDEKFIEKLHNEFVKLVFKVDEIVKKIR